MYQVSWSNIYSLNPISSIITSYEFTFHIHLRQNRDSNAKPKSKDSSSKKNKPDIEVDAEGQLDIELNNHYLKEILLLFFFNREKRDSDSKPKNKDKPKKDIEVDAEGQLDLDNKPSGTLDEYNLENKIRSISDLLPYPKIVIYGKSPLPLDHTKITNVDKEDVEGLVSPPFSSVVYKASEVQKMF